MAEAGSPPDSGSRLRIFVPHASDLLTDNAPHGDGLIALDFLRGLAERGHELDVGVQDLQVRGALPPGLRMHRLAQSGDLGPGGRLVYALRARRLYDRLRTDRPFDVIHQFNPVHIGLTTFLPHDAVPVVLGPYPAPWPTAAGPPPSGAVRTLGVVRGATQWLQQRRAAAILLFSPAAQAIVRVHRPGRLLRQALPRLAVVPPGLDLAAFHPAGAISPPDAADGRRSVLFIGRLEQRKGVLLLLDAFERLAPLHDVELWVAGSGSLADEVLAHAANGPAAGRVRVLGQVERADVPALMRSATLCCLPSLGEPFGMSALEAMACGCPLVVTDAGGPGDVVPAEGGRKVPLGDIAALHHALDEMLALGPDALAACGRANRRAAERYTWPAAIDAVENLYRDLLAA